jgi:hypothetical protein
MYDDFGESIESMNQKALYEFCHIQLVNLPLALLIRSLWNEQGFSLSILRLTGMEGKVRIGAKSGTNPAM